MSRRRSPGSLRSRAASTRSLAGPALLRAYPLALSGQASLPRLGPAGLAVAGRGPLVGPMLAAALPRPVHAVGMPPALGGLGSGTVTAAREAGLLLAAGAVVAVGVEDEAGRALAAFLALRAGARVLPVVVRGAHGRFEADPPRLRSTVTMAVSPPVTLPALGDPCAWDVVRDAAEQVRQHCADAERSLRSQDGMGTS